MNCKKVISLIVALSIGYPIVSIANTQPYVITSAQAKSEGKILGTLNVIDENEISVGNLAKKKSSNQDIKHFAGLLIKDHKNNLNKTKALSKLLSIVVIEDKAAIKLKHNGMDELVTLNKLQGASFDKAFISAMIKGHKHALATIDGLIDKSSNNLIKAHLKSTGIHVEHHLEKAEHIQQSF